MTTEAIHGAQIHSAPPEVATAARIERTRLALLMTTKAIHGAQIHSVPPEVATAARVEPTPSGLCGAITKNSIQRDFVRINRPLAGSFFVGQ